MIINELKEEDILDPEFMNNLITEITGMTIPRNLKKQFKNQELREQLLREYGEKAFLSSEDLKFPIIDPRTGDISCKLLYAARIRAKQFGLNEIEQKAEKIFNQCKCNTRVNIRILDHTQSYDLLELLNALEYDFSDIRKKSI